jgi:hypothetical protein
MQEHVDIAVTMGFQDEVVFFLQGEMGIDIRKGWDEFLAENRDLIWGEAEVGIRSECGERSRIRLTTRHYDERDIATESAGSGQDDLSEMGKVARVLGDFDGDIEFDAVVAETFA